MTVLGFPVHRVLSRVRTGTKRMGEINSADSLPLRFNVEGLANRSNGHFGPDYARATDSRC
jgi:hypothetical protein